MNTKDNGVSKNTRKSTGASGSKDKPANDSMIESTVNINGEPVSVSLPSQAKNGQDGMNINLTINLAGEEKKKRAPRSSGTPQKKKTPKKKTEKKKKKSHWWLLLLLLLLLAFGVYVAYPRLKETILHKHSFSEEWVADETNHWHICKSKKCDEVKDKANHSYDNDCDTTCNVCGAERTTVAHIYDDDCDTTCNICGHTRVAPHSYGEEYESNVFNHWKECPECHTTTPETIHIFSGDCDTACNICGYIRAGLVDHTFGTEWYSVEDGHFHKCTICEEESTPHVAHTFKNGICDVCEYAREELAFSYDSETESYTVTGIGRITDTDIVIPATYDDGTNGSHPVKSVEESAFASLYTSNPSSITSVVFSENMETIGQGAFFGCENLTTVTLSGTIKEIGTWAFAMTGLTSINIPASVETIGDNPFTYCESLTSITVDSANTKFHVNNSCLIDTVNKKIITGLSYSNIPSNSEEVTTIGWGAFAKMSGGTTLKIPSNIVTIGDGAFSDCTSIVSVELPNEIGISNAAFDVCTSLTTIYYAGTQAEWSENVSYNSSYNTAFVNATIYYYSETEPMTTGKYWHYVDSVATPWAEKMTYKVEHYVENESGGYNTPESTENLVGIIGGEVTATPKTYAHYTHDTENDDRVESGTVTSDGNLVLKVYYYRNSYTLTLTKGTGIASVSITGASDVTTISEGKYSIKHGEAVRLIATAEAGYTFSGWTGYSSINSNNVFTMPTENVALTANATANTNTPYTIKYYMQNIADDDFTEDTLRTVNETGTTGTTATITAEYITGFTFDSTKSSNSGTIEGDGSLVLKLYYNRRVGQLFITKGTGIASVTATGDSVVKFNETDSQVDYNVRYGAEVTLTATASDGYTFSGWTVASSSTATITDNKLIQNTANVINITANATANTNTPYKVEHYQEDLAGGTYTLADTDNLTGTTGTTATATAKTDYDYFTHDTSNTNRVESGTIAGDGSLVLRVYYTRKTGTLLIGKNTGVDTVSASGTGVTVTTGTATYTRYSVKYGAEVTLSATASTGYTLAGWEKGSETLSGNTYTHNALEIMVTAKATANTYSLAYNTNGGGTIASTNKTYNTAFIGAELPTNLTKTGYAFAGWFNDSSFTTEVEIGDLFTTTNATFTNVSTASTTATIYAKWTEITYTIAFDNNGGSGEMASLTNVAYSENKTLTTNTFEKEGYTFLGWATTSTGSKVYDDGQSVSGLSATDGATITLYAVWQDNSSENSGSGGE